MSEFKSSRETAVACGSFLSEWDRARKQLGINCESIVAGKAKLSMLVVETMLNATDICHGGVIFTLADTAFAFACNSQNIVTVATSCNIDFLRPARLGDTLYATAEECEFSGRNGVYDVVVKNQDHEVVALFRGKCRRLGRPVVPDSATDSENKHS